ncbi:MAG: DUF2341 domain-containing protein, partial [Thermoproteota archaeon]
YYREVTITNSGSSALSNYVVKIVLDTATLISQGKMRSDAGDIRVFDSDQSTLLNYWINPDTINTANTVIWVKIPSIPASSSKKIYISYGKPDLTSASNGYNVFLFFEDWSSYAEGTSVSAGKTNPASFVGGWVLGGGTTYSTATITTFNGRKRLKLDDQNYHLYIQKNTGLTLSNVRVIMEGYFDSYSGDGANSVRVYLSDGSVPSPYYQASYMYSWGVDVGGSAVAIQKRIETTWTNIASASPGNIGTGNIATIEGTWYGSTFTETAYRNYQLFQSTISGTDSTWASRNYVGIYMYAGIEGGTVGGMTTWYFYYIAIAPYVSPDPTTSVGAEKITPPQTCPYPSNTVYLNHTFVSSPASSTFTFSLSSSNSSASSYTSPYYDNYGFKVSSLRQIMANVQYPNSYSVLYGTLIGGTLTNLQAEDYVPMRFQAYNDTIANKQYAVVDFVATLPSSIPISTVSYIMLYTSGNVSMTTSKTYTNIYVYNFATSSFSLLSATAYNSTTRVSYSTSITSPSNYFDASGNFKLRVNYTYPTGLTSTPAKLDIDILKITFKYYNGTSVTLTATASITLPYSTQTLKNITFQGISTYSGIARSINITLTNSGGAKIATGAFTPSASWQTFSIPINTNASGTLTVKVILYALSSASANEEVTVKDIKLFG